MAKIEEDYYSRYATGKFSVQGSNFASQYKNKPQLPWPLIGPKASVGIGTCDFHHCQVCKKPVKDEPHGGFCGELNCKTCHDFMMLKKPVTGRHYTGMAMDDLTEDEISARDAKKMHQQYEKWLDHNKSTKEVNMSENTKSYEFQNLYEIVTTYGGDRDSVIVKRTDVVAETEERALLQVKDAIEPDWDLDYVEQDVTAVCAVRIKRKPRETKEVAK